MKNITQMDSFIVEFKDFSLSKSEFLLSNVILKFMSYLLNEKINLTSN